MSQMREELIAPCGMNCRICISFQRKKNACSGCRKADEIIYVTKGSRVCAIKQCPQRQSDAQFCFQCEKFPCRRIKDLDKRYRTKYHMSMIENLTNIKNHGIGSFLEVEENRWTCPNCANIVSVHKSVCLECQTRIFDELENQKE